MMKVLIVNGPNLNLLGTREPDIYGNESMDEVINELRTFSPEMVIDYFQSNHEGAIIDRLQKRDYSALIINPGALSHYSYAIADCLRNIPEIKVEVHISNIYRREEFRRKSVTADAVDAVLTGFGVDGYLLALNFLQKRLPNEQFQN